MNEGRMQEIAMMTALNSRLRRTVLAAFPAVLLVAGCAASGPSDFVDLAATQPAPPPSAVRTAEQRDKLERDLTALGNRQEAAGAAADNGLPSAMALAVIRQQQNEEARALLEAAGPVPPAAAPAACPDGATPAADGTCPKAP
jgi:hypothetical protein